MLRLKTALDGTDVEELKDALREYADTTQHVRLQVLAREMLTKLLLSGKMDASLKRQLQQQLVNRNATSSSESRNAEVERYYHLARGDLSDEEAVALARTHLDAIRGLTRNISDS